MKCVKKIVTFALLLTASVGMQAQLPQLNYKRLNAQAAKAYEQPIRPGYEGRNPYWNGYATRFLYAPAFDFQPMEGAKKYQYEVKTANQSFMFTATAPNFALTPVWSKIPVGKVKLTVSAVGKSGEILGQVGQREFSRDVPFSGPYHEPACSYKESAIKALLYLHHLKPILKFEKSLEPDMSFWQFAYPCKTVSAIIRSELMLTNYSKRQGPQAFQIAKNCGDFLISISQSPEASLAYFPPTYYGNQKAAGKALNQGKTMSMEAAKAALAFLDLYDYTKEEKYKNQALGIVRTYKKIQRPDGSIAIKLFYETGEAVNQLNASLHPLLYVLQRLEDQYKIMDFKEMRLLSERWMETTAYEKFEMTGQFEDVSVENLKPYENLTHWTGVPYISYAMACKKLSPEMTQLARDVLNFSEDQFTVWQDAPNEDGIHYFDTPCVTEQYKYWTPIDDSAASMAVAWLRFYQQTGDKVALAKSQALFDKITLVQHSNNGLIPTVWTPHYSESTCRDLWPSCMLYTIQALMEFSKFVGE